ncbi:MAG: Ribosomal RNA small subunit methyltransferase B [Syntrophorhabdus sp. PtaU1.Bin058]|nr:MAG: Ribosomal RNA small subunit methyltransferase B [Syntrophorhabdus sp. PtaU1.Bin058]
MTAGAIRWKRYFEWALSLYTDRPIASDLRYLLWLSLYQVSFMKKAPYHVVNEVVAYTKKEKGKRVANFVNAVLRQYLRDRDVLQAGGDSRLATDDLSIQYSFPGWIIERWQKRFGRPKTAELLSVLNKTPGFTLRVNLKNISVEETARQLEADGIKTRRGVFSPAALHVEKLAPVLHHRLFKDNMIAIQDEMSQLVGLSLDPQPGDAILDACAGSGTKTHHIQDIRAEGFVVSMDNGFKRLRLVRNKGNVLLGDALHPPFRERSFDIILVDAPCSSFGIIGKHPEIKWRKRAKDIGSFGDSQVKLLGALWDILKTGGRIVYSVCSFEPEETTDVIERLRKSAKFILENPLPFLFNKEYFLSLPHETGMDGFFIAKLRKL